jgi:putative peptidoglycan lipid II flippase
MLRAFATVSGFIFLSRIFGFIRDILIARFLGSSAEAEAFFVAFRLPNLFRRIFAEGAFNAAFVPIFSKKLSRDSQQSAIQFAEEAFSVLLISLIVMTVIAQLFMPVLVLLIASGFAYDADKMNLAVLYSRITFPYLLLMSLTALMSGVLNAFNKFAITSAAPVLLNIVLISFMLVAHYAEWSFGYTLSWAVLTSGILQFFIVYRALNSDGLKIRLIKPRMSNNVKNLIRLGGPGLIASGVMQINLLISMQIASQFEGGIAWMYYADRLYQLPVGLIGAAISVVLLPRLSSLIGQNDNKALAASVRDATRWMLFLAIPSAVGLCLIADMIVRTLFFGNEFGEQDVRNTAQILQIFALGVPAYVLSKIMSPLYFAHEDMKHPMFFSLATMVINVVVSIASIRVLGVLSVPFGNVISVWCNVILLWGGLFFIQKQYAFAMLSKRIVAIIGASAAMGVVLAILKKKLPDDYPQILVLLGIIGVGFLSYAFCAWMLGAFGRKDIKALLQRKKR